MASFSSAIDILVEQLDVAVEAHMDWTRRVLRCAVLRVSPGDDVLSPLAYDLCRFGCWFRENKAHFEALNEAATERIERTHKAMHGAIRSICIDILANKPGQSDYLDTFEQAQSELIERLADFKTQLLATSGRQDPLTDLPLRYGLEDDFTEALKICDRNKMLLYVVMIDVDHFKAVNDNYGHPIGDVALRDLADTLKTMVRSNERLYRYGGEEFLLLMQADSPESMKTPAQRLLEAVRNMRVPIPDGEPLALTVTLGLA
ncbi:MAG: diguanylate cyclase, partial [Gammaproteobacteria bacterium]|nr:diguanylate cyclase [Gammaproteobacteria bacterium]